MTGVRVLAGDLACEQELVLVTSLNGSSTTSSSTSTESTSLVSTTIVNTQTTVVRRNTTEISLLWDFFSEVPASPTKDPMVALTASQFSASALGCERWYPDLLPPLLGRLWRTTRARCRRCTAIRAPLKCVANGTSLSLSLSPSPSPSLSLSLDLSLSLSLSSLSLSLSIYLSRSLALFFSRARFLSFSLSLSLALSLTHTNTLSLSLSA